MTRSGWSWLRNVDPRQVSGSRHRICIVLIRRIVEGLVSVDKERCWIAQRTMINLDVWIFILMVITHLKIKQWLMRRNYLFLRFRISNKTSSSSDENNLEDNLLVLHILHRDETCQIESQSNRTNLRTWIASQQCKVLITVLIESQEFTWQTLEDWAWTDQPVW